MAQKRFDYILIFIEYLKRKNGQVVDVRTVAEELKLPRAYLGKIAQELKLAGLIESRKGAGGGYWLTKNAPNISINTLINFYAPLNSFCPLLRNLNK